MENDINYKVGDDIVCINDKPLQGRRGTLPIHQGQVYPCNALLKQCKCGAVWVDVGVKSDKKLFTCSCGKAYKKSINILLFNGKRFSKKEDDGTLTAEALLQQLEVELVPVHNPEQDQPHRLR